MKCSGTVGALIGVRAEEVALCLDEVRACMRGTERIQIGERVCHGRQGQPCPDARSGRAAQALMVCGNFFVEKAVEQEVPEQRIAPECGGDIVQKVCLARKIAAIVPRSSDQ